MKKKRWLCFAVSLGMVFSSRAWATEQVPQQDLSARVEILEKELQQKNQQLEEIQASLKQVLSEVQAIKNQQARPIPPAAIKAVLDKTFAVEKPEEVKKFTQYVCGKGHVFALDTPNHRCPECGEVLKAKTIYRKVKLARRESIADKIGAMLGEDKKKRIQVGLSGTGVLQQILRSESNHDGAFGEGSVDLIFVAQPLTYGLFFVDLEGIGGNGPDEVLKSRAILNADAGSLQDNDGVDRVRVREAWAEFDFFAKKLQLTAGKIDLTNYFDQNTVANDETTQFLTGAFVNNAILQNPINGPGLNLLWNSKRGLTLHAAVQKPGDTGALVSERLYGIAEVDTQSHWFFGREGNYRLWGRINGNTEEDNVGFGISFDQVVCPEWTAFTRYGVGEPRVENGLGKWAWSAGVQKKAPLPLRLKDTWALALGQQKDVVLGRNWVAESYYKLFFSQHFSATLNFQWLVATGSDITPADGEEAVDPIGTSDHAYLVGLRSQIDF